MEETKRKRREGQEKVEEQRGAGSCAQCLSFLGNCQTGLIMTILIYILTNGV